MSKNITSAPEDDIVSFDQALELCIMGYDEPTFCMYEIENRQLCLCHLDEDGLYMPDKDLHAPTKSQVFRWLRDEYGLYHFIYHTGDDYGHLVWRLVIKDIHTVLLLSSVHLTYEEAENTCIDKLIELAKQK